MCVLLLNCWILPYYAGTSLQSRKDVEENNGTRCGAENQGNMCTSLEWKILYLVLMCGSVCLLQLLLGETCHSITDSLLCSPARLRRYR
jgi:hypothetical protein